jgi:hypothetical protein
MRSVTLPSAVGAGAGWRAGNDIGRIDARHRPLFDRIHDLVMAAFPDQQPPSP